MEDGKDPKQGANSGLHVFDYRLPLPSQRMADSSAGLCYGLRGNWDSGGAAWVISNRRDGSVSQAETAIYHLSAQSPSG